MVELRRGVPGALLSLQVVLRLQEAGSYSLSPSVLSGEGYTVDLRLHRT